MEFFTSKCKRRSKSEEPALVNYMIRIAILGLSQDACWDALQDSGWTDPQLARLQQAVDTTRMLRQLPRVVEAERAARVAHWRSFREHSYRHWIKRYGDLGKGFGIALPDFTRAPLAQRWREWGFHPLWQFAWADQEELDDLQQSRSTLAAVTDSVGCFSWKTLITRVNEIVRDYQPPAAQWRFHGHLPILDELSMVVGSPQSQNPRRSSLGHLRAWEVTFEHLTSHQLFVTAVALRRHAMWHGTFPETLNALVPDLLTEPPVDYMDGAPLRYRRNKDGTFLLYSVGADGRDDGGDHAPKSGTPTNPLPLAGRDWVWPRMASTH